jgi:hypothetical protein
MHLEPGDQLLLCSDGLTDLVADDEIRDILNMYSQQEALDKLIQLANRRGGHDNITMIGIQAPDKLISAPRPQARSRLVLALVLLVVITAFLAGGWVYRTYYWEEVPDPTSVPTVTVGLSLPTVVPTSIPPTLRETATPPTPILSPSPISSPSSIIDTPIQATYTPWPTSTGIP